MTDQFQNPSPIPAQPGSNHQSPQLAWMQIPTSWNVASAQLGTNRPASPPQAPRDYDPVYPDEPETATGGNKTPQGQARPPAPKAPWVIALIVLIVVAGVLWFGTREVPQVEQTPSPKAPTTQPTPQTPGSFQSSIPFDHDGVTGQFSVDSYEWSGGDLVATVTIEVTGGSFDYSFLFMDVATGDIYEMETPTADELKPERISSGDTVQGKIRCQKNQGDTSVVLRDEDSDSNLAIVVVAG